MAPVPHRRSRSETEDSVLLGIESASSSLRPGPSKRQRLSTLTPGVETDGYSDIGRDSREVTVYEDEPFNPQDYETRRDARLNNDIQNQEKDDLRSTQLVRQHFDEFKENLPAQNGIIERVSCTNFMCHENLTVPMGPLINFIIGHNGSGKSAVLTALTICLGGKATSTNRGQSLKSFIKEGKDTCTLAVKIKNQGDTAYRPELYGSSITVERHFSRAGTSGFKLRGANDRIVSTKRADLDDISDHFALQLDNPMNVLTQDMARQFLNNSSAADKYKFFVKGTQLEQLDMDYMMLEELVDSTEVKIQQRLYDVEVLKSNFRQAEEKHKIAQANEGLNDKIRNLTRQMAWAQVEEEENQLAKYDNGIGQLDQKIADREAAAEQQSTEYTGADESHNRAEQDVNRLQEELRPQQEQYDEINKSFQENKTKLLESQSQQRDLNSSLRTAKANVEKAKAGIEEEKRRLEDQNGGEHARRLEEVEEAKEQSERLRGNHESHQQQKAGLDQAKDAARRDLAAAEPVAREAENSVKDAERLLQNLQSNQGQQNAGYDPRLPTLLRAIQSETRFRERPVGPIGHFVRLKQSKIHWSSILERTFGGALSAFVVTSNSDERILRDISRRVGCSVNVYIGNGQPLDISNTQPDPQYDTIFRILEISSNLVQNMLIINSAIEQTVLIESQEDALNFMYGSNGARPRNTKACVCFAPNPGNDSKKRGEGIRYSNTANATRSDPVLRWEQASRIQIDNEAQIRYQRENVDLAKKDLEDADAKKVELQRTLRGAERDLADWSKTSKQLKLDYDKADEHWQQIRDALEEEIPQDGRLEELQNQLREAEAETHQYEEDFGNGVVEKDLINDAQTKIREQMNGLQALVDECNAKIEKANKKINTLRGKREDALREKNLAIQKVEDTKNDKTELEQVREQQREKVEEFHGEASKICPRVPVDEGKTTDHLEKELDMTIKQLERARSQQGGSLEDLIRATTVARRAWTAAQKELHNLGTLAHEVKVTMVARRDRWIDFRRFISSRARANFSYLLSERAFRGSLKLDHKSKLLDLSVEPDITRSSDKGRQTKTLSGGEKSFSTICLLLSIWEAMGSPIRCLDEFDVFMDNVNRDVSMKMMINAARRSVGRQFVLITPQAMGNVDSADDVKIHKMRDPERGQTTLQFGT
ncbi:MAG: Structural maintenance of chromosomes protein 6 [Bogoriella megaspora]|nr:MAG: Structural maintenance of chromosomes protein 6 [Bogoriella megaspora]